MFRNVYVVPVEGNGEAREITYLSNSFSNSLSWSPDAKFLLMDTGQRTEQSRVARIDLVPRTPRFREDQFRDLFKEEKEPGQGTPDVTPEKSDKIEKPETKPAESESLKKLEGETAKKEENGKTEKADKKAPPKTEITLEGIRDRLSVVPLGLD